MATYREMVYAALEQVKAMSDDAYISEEYTLFLISKVRAAILTQFYQNARKEITAMSESNYQTVEISFVDSTSTRNSTNVLTSTQVVPDLLKIGNVKVFTGMYGISTTDLPYVSLERFKYVGHNTWLKNIIYSTIGTDKKLYLKSGDGALPPLSSVNIRGIFANPEIVDNVIDGDNWDLEFPLEGNLVNMVIETVCKYLASVDYRPADSLNNAIDDSSNIMSFLRRNLKSDLAKSLTE
jgi:hypothetical protein